MSTMAPYKTPVSLQGNDFPQLVHAEWTKFRTVRGWVVGAVAAALVVILLAFLTASGSHSESCINGKCVVNVPTVVTGPGGEAVDDQFYFVHQALTGDGSITARLTSMTGKYSAAGPVHANGGGMQSGLQPWTKVGVILKASTQQGSAYAAVVMTGSHGLRMQDNFTGDVAGPAGEGSQVSAADPRWLRLTRAGDKVTGSWSADGTRWTDIATVTLTLPTTAQAGLLAASPDYSVSVEHLGGGGSMGGPTSVTGVLDQVQVQGSSTADGWTGSELGVDPEGGNGPGPLLPVGFTHSGASFTVSGFGDVAPAVGGRSADGGSAYEHTLVGAFLGLIVLIVLAAQFVTGEYRRGLVHTTLAASPRRGQVVAAKALVAACVAFCAGLVASAVSLPLGAHLLRHNGNAMYPASTFTLVRMVVGTATVMALTAALAVAVGVLLRRGAGTVTAMIAAVVVPYILATAYVLPAGPAEWLLRLTPAAGFAVQQSIVRYEQVAGSYTPSEGFFPLAPWAGLAVLAAWTAAGLALAVVAIGRRDA
jgi:ABC-type transport system involved in multi-copper enzyme maturation permease subunit